MRTTGLATADFERTGPTAKECQQSLQTGKNKKMGSPIEHPERSVPQLTPWF
jgi:hypothetical protein